MATESVTERSARIRKERIAALRKKRMSAQARAAAAKPNTPRIIKAKAAQNASREKTKSRVASAMKSLGNINAKGLRNARDDAEGVLVSNVPRADRQQRLKGIKKAAKAGTLAQNPDAFSVSDLPKGAKNPDVLRVTGRPAKNPDAVSLRNLPKPAMNPDAVSVRNLPKPAKNPDAYNKLKPSKDKGYFSSSRKANPTSTVTATPKANPRRPTVGGDMMGTTPPGGGTLSKKDVDEYSEAFASPDADKMYKLSEKNRRTDMNMLERALDSIAKGGDRATAERRKRGLSDYDMTEEEMIYDSLGGAKKGGRVGATMKKTKKSSTRKRAAQRGFGVETRGN